LKITEKRSAASKTVSRFFLELKKNVKRSYWRILGCKAKTFLVKRFLINVVLDGEPVDRRK